MNTSKFHALISLRVTFFFFLFLIVVPSAVVGDNNCTCDRGGEDGVDKDKALHYKLGAIAAILVAGAAGVCLPLLGKAVPALRPEKDVFFVIKSFAAGVILATGFIHVLPDAFEHLTSPCLPEDPWGNFPFTGFVAMLAAVGTLMVDTLATSYYQKAHFGGGGKKASSDGKVVSGDEEREEEHANHVHVHTHATHGHSHGAAPTLTEDGGASDLLRHRVISQVLELGIIVHSVIIGISLGASETPDTIRPLILALSFHQFFEGMGLGGCIAQAQFKGRSMAVMALFFSLTTPVGIAIGIWISNGYDENSNNALIVEGIFNAASAGILIYMALVDLLAADFMSARMQSNGKLKLSCNVSLLLGAGCMSLLAKWA